MPEFFYNLTYEKLVSRLEEMGERKYRAQQLYSWVYRMGTENFDEMTDISKKFRNLLPEIFHFKKPDLVSHSVSTDGTQKFLFSLGCGKTYESVLIPSKDRLTLCVSSEVGCNLACKFCFTGKQKLKQRLTSGEIVSQFMVASKHVPQHSRITNIVFMGMGEPLDNVDAVFDSIKIFHHPAGLNLSRKKITVSTSGIVPLIPKVTESGTRLAVSLNAADDSTRSQIMPINKRWPIASLLEACREHSRVAKDKVTIEYVLLKGVTDTVDDARKLARLTRSVPCKINIIPFNEHPGSDFMRPDDRQVDLFQSELMKLGVHVLRRRTMGRDIFAACGQLTSYYEEHPQQMTV